MFFKASGVCGLCLGLLLTLTACAGGHHRDPDAPATALVQTGDQIAARGDTAGATEFYRRALELNPDDADALVGLATQEMRIGALNQALAHARQAVVQEPTYGVAQRTLGRILFLQGQLEPAEKAYQAALDRDSHDIKAVNGLAAVRDRRGAHGEAQKMWRHVLESHPDDQATVNNLAFSLMSAGSSEAAVDILKPWMSRPACLPTLRQNLALAYARTGRLNEAELLARQDLSGPVLRRRLAFLKGEAAKAERKPALEMGPYATMEMASAALQRVKTKPGLNALDIEAEPVLTAPGGTPHFDVRITGDTPQKLQLLCDRLMAEEERCALR